MNEAFFTGLSAWLVQAGLAGTSETDIVTELCDRCVAAGLPLDRAHVFIDTLHPVHEGRLFRWGFAANKSALLEYGRTDPERSPRLAIIRRMSRRPSAGGAACSTKCCKPATRLRVRLDRDHGFQSIVIIHSRAS